MYELIEFRVIRISNPCITATKITVVGSLLPNCISAKK